MSLHPATRASNANKHPGDIVRAANRQQHPKEEIAAEKKRKQDEKEAKSAAAEQAHIKTAMQEDAMAIQQQAQLAGPPKLVRPRPHVPGKKHTEPEADPGDAQLILGVYLLDVDTRIAVQTKSATQNIEQKRHAPLRLTFRDSVVVNRKVSNSGISISDGSETRVGSTVSRDGKRITKSLQSSTQLGSEGIVENWADKVVSAKPQGRPSAPSSVHTAITDNCRDEIDFEVDNAPDSEEYEPCRGRGRKVTVDKSSDVEETGDADGFADEESLEIPGDPDATANSDDGEGQDPRWRCGNERHGGCGSIYDICEIPSDTPPHNMQMSVDISDNKTVMKRIKAKDDSDVATSRAASINLRKVKPRNAHIPDDIVKSWRVNSFQCSCTGWEIPAMPGPSQRRIFATRFMKYTAVLALKIGQCVTLKLVLTGYELAVQKIHEWKASFGSTAITVLMAFFASKPEYQTQAARKAFADDQLEDSRFIYENPESEDNPGAFLSDCSCRSVHFPWCLTTIWFHATPPISNSKKNHKIKLTFNESTNRMSHTGTAFSAANWEMDTMAYMETMLELPQERVKEIITRATPFMKRAHRSRHID
ncbi:hypothetical protein DFH29DRAFT_873367 [Suillus ampliporus]|nr:hypothetical protein DFH29DRAFT_873367 [Suillus ampliporus]